MSLKPSSPSTNIPNTDPFDSVAYTDIVEGSIDDEKEVSKLMKSLRMFNINSARRIVFKVNLMSYDRIFSSASNSSS